MNSEHITEIDEIADKLVLAKLLENDAKAALRKLLQDAAKPETQWRDMDSAPLAGGDILIHIKWKVGNRVVVGFLEPNGVVCVRYPGGGFHSLEQLGLLGLANYTAVGWMPLPEPRKKAE
jgi:hypothetical protein